MTSTTNNPDYFGILSSSGRSLFRDATTTIEEKYDYYDDKSIPLVRTWELDDNSTRYDINLAAPPDDIMMKYWYGWSVVSLLAGTYVLVIFLSIVTCRKVRQQTFNLYLLFLIIPDIIFSFCCGITCVLNATHGHYYSHEMCNFQQFYVVWGIGCNCWLNAIISYQLHDLLICSQVGKRYTIPTKKQVTYQAIAVYVYCAMLGSLGLIQNSKFPYHTLPINGLACIPVELDWKSSLFFWLLLLPCFSLLPILYVIYVAYKIYKYKLLPPSGKRRALTIYFGRIILVFILVWGPYFLIDYILASWLPIPIKYAGGVITHIQPPLSASFSLTKPDVYYAVKRFLTCGWRRTNRHLLPNGSTTTAAAATNGGGGGTAAANDTSSGCDDHHSGRVSTVSGRSSLENRGSSSIFFPRMSSWFSTASGDSFGSSRQLQLHQQPHQEQEQGYGGERRRRLSQRLRQQEQQIQYSISERMNTTSSSVIDRTTFISSGIGEEEEEGEDSTRDVIVKEVDVSNDNMGFWPDEDGEYNENQNDKEANVHDVELKAQQQQQCQQQQDVETHSDYSSQRQEEKEDLDDDDP